MRTAVKLLSLSTVWHFCGSVLWSGSPSLTLGVKVSSGPSTPSFSSEPAGDAGRGSALTPPELSYQATLHEAPSGSTWSLDSLGELPALGVTQGGFWKTRCHTLEVHSEFCPFLFLFFCKHTPSLVPCVWNLAVKQLNLLLLICHRISF